MAATRARHPAKMEAFSDQVGYNKGIVYKLELSG